ncbi:neurensin-1-like [Lethenteron reissneri]|uniref:neurensin-1-like n=1 Tax=Lethenteron reissneri TaxID=7753 RepID=UPI002AB77888|nr:neurensin-1-like [Lethenteron reissneri]XP_061425121.1 neurensin-1-like [Lethenteron reissneri]
MAMACPECSFCSHKEAVHSRQYGVRSYLHYFYRGGRCGAESEGGACGNPRLETARAADDQCSDELEKENRLCASSMYNAGAVTGCIILLIGIAVVCTGYLIPPKIESFGKGDFFVVDKHALRFNRALEMCKLSGAILFCLGGTSLALGIVLSACSVPPLGDDKGAWFQSQEQGETRHSDGKARGGWARAAEKLPVALSKVLNVQPSVKTG